MSEMKNFEREMEESCSHFGEREEHVKKNEEEEEISKTCDQAASCLLSGLGQCPSN